MDNLEIIKNLEEQTKNLKGRSAWNKGIINSYIPELIENLKEHTKYNNEQITIQNLKTICLNGAENFSQYSWGGCSLCYNDDICETLCSPSEQKRTNYGNWRPNKNEDWLDVQARAIYQAFCKIKTMLKNILNK